MSLGLKSQSNLSRDYQEAVWAFARALAPITGFDEKAIVVFADGIENRLASSASVKGAIDSRTFAIGLDSETQVDTAALV